MEDTEIKDWNQFIKIPQIKKTDNAILKKEKDLHKSGFPHGRI